MKMILAQAEEQRLLTEDVIAYPIAKIWKRGIAMIYRIALGIQAAAGSILIVLGQWLWKEDLSAHWLTGAGVALLGTGLALLLILFVLKNRRFTDKDKRTVIGVIEKKALKRKMLIDHASALAFKSVAYLLTLAIITVALADGYSALLRAMLVLAAVKAVLFVIGYLVAYLKFDESEL